MSVTLVDANVLLDIATNDAVWARWSADALATEAELATLAINSIIYAEVSVRYERIEELDAALPPTAFRRDPIPWEAAFLAGKCFIDYRRRGGACTAPLPDFFIGAHAAVSGYALLTRDPGRYRTYFPRVRLIAP